MAAAHLASFVVKSQDEIIRILANPLKVLQNNDTESEVRNTTSRRRVDAESTTRSGDRRRSNRRRSSLMFDLYERGKRAHS